MSKAYDHILVFKVFHAESGRGKIKRVKESAKKNRAERLFYTKSERVKNRRSAKFFLLNKKRLKLKHVKFLV